MGKLKIRQVEYVGTQYYYKSPNFQSGINIIEGKNGTGKSTLIGLICFALGIYVEEFDPKKQKLHKEVCEDVENFVKLDIELNDHFYTLKRFFYSNVIFVINGEEINEYPIRRSETSQVIFSDWIMSELGISVVELYQGTKKSKINFSDIFRLLHYDQNTSPNKIYKEHRTDGNFVADSLFMRKVIFELLMGTAFSDYYSCIGKVIKLERDREAKKAITDNYEQVLNQSGFAINIIGISNLAEKITELKVQLNKAELHRENLKNTEYTLGNAKGQLAIMRKELLDTELEYSDLVYNKLQLLNELQNISRLKDEIILEVTQLRKIIVAHEELNLFSPDTCPYCLKLVDREPDHCICGSPIAESEYERFFYTSEEYLDILRSKQKSVETVESALTDCNNEYQAVLKKTTDHEFKINKIRDTISKIDTVFTAKNIEFNEVDDKILEIKGHIQSVEQNIAMLEKYNQFKVDLATAQALLAKANSELATKEDKIKTVMETKLHSFNTIYQDLMSKSSSKIIKARIDEDYMPVINDGEYREASSQVPKRFMYYITLLNMSLKDKDILFPRFLLIDTPENLGIDRENLVDCISQVNQGKQEGEDDQFQIILTTGLGKYPVEFQKKVLQTLRDDAPLLIKTDNNRKEENENQN